MRLLSCLVAVTALALSVAPSALAAQTHPYTGVSFGPDGVGGSQSFQRLQALSLDSSGNVYAYDPSAGKVYKFDAAGNPVNFSSLGTNAIEGVNGSGAGAEFEIAIAPPGSPASTAGDIYVANNSHALQVYAPSGTKLGEIAQDGFACGTAVDPSGNFYAGLYPSTVNKYTPDANPPTTANETSGTVEHGICNVAADGLGNVYAANYNGNGVFKLESITDTTPVEVDPIANTLAIAPGSNDLYADRESEVVQYDSSGSLIGSFGSGDISSSRGVAVNSGATSIYVGTEAKVKVFGASVIVPDVTAEAATGVASKKATLHGLVNSAGLPVTGCEFEYDGEGPNFKVPCEGAIPNDGNDHQVSAALTGLVPEHSYRFRLIATNDNGQRASNRLVFRTLTGAVTEPATEITAMGAKLNGVVRPENETVSECVFEYGPSEIENENYSSSAPCVGEIPADEAAHPVSAVISGLQRGAQYHFRLTIVQPGGKITSAPRELEPAGAVPSAEEVRNVGADQATLAAEINPRGLATSYFFEYGPTTSYGSTTPEEDIGDGTEFLPVSQTITGLTPATTYHWRLVVTDSFGEGPAGPDRAFATKRPSGSPESGCPNQSFREFAGATLPDCRAYEQASPADKDGLNVEGFTDILAAASDGSRVSFYSQGGSGIPAQGGAHQEFTTLVSSRVGESWSTQRLLPPEQLGTQAGTLGSSQDLRYSLVETQRFADEVSQNGLYVIDAADGSLTQILPLEIGPEGSRAFQYAYDGVSADGSWVFFETQEQLTPNAAGEEHDNLYMWNRASGGITLVSVLPGGAEEAPPAGAFGGAYAWFGGDQTYLGGSLAGYYVESLHAITANGDQAFFTAGETGQLYLRRGLTGSSPSTIHVSAPEAGVSDPSGPLPAAFQEATPDGSRAFFLSSEKLTADATSAELSEGKDLYRYDAETGTLVDVTPDSGDTNGARVQGLLGAAADGSSGYFVAQGVLAPGGTSGQNNIYRFSEQGGSFALTFVARLAKNEANEGRDARNWSPRSNVGTLSENTSAKTSRVTPDGQTLVFSSQRSQTGYTNKYCWTGRFPGCGSFQEVYRYSAGSESLTCISCNPTGEVPLGDAQLSTEVLNAHLVPRVYIESRLTRNVTPDGSRVFFQSPDPLVPGDTNADAGCTYRNENGRTSPDCLDVYEWEAVDAPGGSCHEAEVNGGCLYLLSTGKSRDASYFIDASTDGTSAFIGTTSQLVPADKDALYDAYNVRTDGGLASQHVTPPTPCSSGEACHGSSSREPDVSSPGSSSFQGPGNPKSGKTKAKKCKKKAHGNCAKKHKKKHPKKSAKRLNATTRKAGGSE